MRIYMDEGKNILKQVVCNPVSYTHLNNIIQIVQEVF